MQTNIQPSRYPIRRADPVRQMADFFPKVLICTSYFLCFASAATYPGDLAILRQFHDGLTNADLLKWTSSDADPCGNRWNYIFCSGNRVTQIEVQKLGLRGNLTRNLNGLTELTHLGLQNNEFEGPLPSLTGLSSLQYAYFDYNRFDSIPGDFFVGLDSLRILALDGNSLNGSSGWMFPDDLRNSPQLMNLTCNSCNLAGQLPDYLGSMASLQVLLLSNNMLSGEIPASFSESGLQILWLNDQRGGGMSGGIDLVTSMVSLTSLWLHGNSFSGKIPTNIGDLVALKDLNLNSNKLVGLVPDSLASMSLDSLDLNNNYFMGPMPKFKAAKATCASNPFCLPTPGSTCAPEVMALIDFLDRVDYPARLVSSWQGNNPCAALWFGLSCDTNGKVSAINLPSKNLTGDLSPSVAKLNSLLRVQLQSNDLSGAIPSNWTGLQSLTYLDLSNNNISFPLPKFSSSVKLLLNGNNLLRSNQTASPLVPGSTPNSSSGGSSSTSSGGGFGSPATTVPGNSSGSGSSTAATSNLKHSNSILLAIIASVACLVILLCLAIPLCFYCIKKKNTNPAPSSLVVYPRDPSDSDNVVKIAVASNTQGSTSMNGSGSGSWNSSGFGGETHVVEAGNLIISVQVLRNVTKNFAPQNELGRGGFGVVYKGQLDDGTKIAVKRMEAGMIGNKALDEFQAEIAVLSKVRHRHLVSLLGYSIEGYERILVYEYMPQGTLSKHLFHWKSLNLEPLSWKRRLNIALDVARGMEYLHSLAHQSFIHRDLKSSNILLADDYRAKVSDFGLVKLAPDGEKSIVTRLAGTFGYLAPEYAVTGKITTKADVFSFGVVLMELLTGLMALDEERPEESQYLVGYFWNIKSDREKLMAAIDPILDRKGETFESIAVITELAGHCTAREPSQRPDMSHAVNVLSPLVEKWRPFDDDAEEYLGINYSMPLNQMVKDWQEAEGEDASFMDLEDSKGSIPARPTGFAESFTSIDAR